MPKLSYSIPALRHWRQARRLTLDDLSLRTRVAKSRLSCIERGGTVNAERFSAILMAIAAIAADDDVGTKDSRPPLGLARRLSGVPLSQAGTEAQP